MGDAVALVLPENPRVAIVGSREFQRLDWVVEFVKRLPDDAIVVSGHAPGVDQRAERAANERGLRTLIFPAAWGEHGKAAGFIRNQQIVDAADVVVAFWNEESNGTKHTMELATNAGKPLKVFTWDHLAAI